MGSIIPYVMQLDKEVAAEIGEAYRAYLGATVKSFKAAAACQEAERKGSDGSAKVERTTCRTSQALAKIYKERYEDLKKARDLRLIERLNMWPGPGE